jgi:hypothetical protein
MNNLKCSKCKEIKSLDNFSKSSKYKRGYDYRCKPCNRTRAIEYHTKNKEDILFKWKTKRLNLTKEEKEQIALKSQINYRDNYIRLLVQRARERARNNNYICDLDEDDIILPEKCPLLNVPFVLGDPKNKWYTYSLDKIDPQKGYTKDNIQIITYLANTMKNKASKEELITFAKNILKLFKEDDIV